MKKLLFLLTLALAIISCSRDEGTNTSPTFADENAPGFVGNSTSGEFNSTNNQNNEQYNEITENPFIKTSDQSISTFSIDADGGAYGNMRRFLNDGQQPPVDAIRTEELINYFNYDYAEPTGNHPISLEGEISSCPWNNKHKLMRIGIKGEKIEPQNYPASNLVFLVDISGSMRDETKLPLLKSGMKLMVEQLTENDVISIVTYASKPGVALSPTAGTDKNKIITAIEALSIGGSTNGEGGIRTAYKLAEENFIDDGNNRIILGTDGDFNVGISSQEELVALIEEEREKGIFLTAIGLGKGNYREDLMEQLADNGNGTYEYIDDLEQARKVFVEEFNKFFTVAKDVKVQVDFNPDYIKEYRLIGYENRVLETEDFEDDQKDAGEIGAGQSITALYELIVEDNAIKGIKAFTVDFRYKHPNEDNSILMQLEVSDKSKLFSQATDNHQFAAAVASFGLLLRDSEYKGNTSYDKVKSWATEAKGFDPFGYKREFIDLIDLAE